MQGQILYTNKHAVLQEYTGNQFIESGGNHFWIVAEVVAYNFAWPGRGILIIWRSYLARILMLYWCYGHGNIYQNVVSMLQEADSSN